MTFIVNQDGTEAFNLDFARNIFVTSQGEIKVATDFSRGGLIGKYTSAEEAERAFEMVMYDISAGRMVIRAPEQERVRSTAPKSRRHFTDGSVQTGHGGS